MARLIEERGIKHPGVLKAMGNIPRERFMEEALANRAYSDSALPIGEKQTISQPWIVARMTELTRPDGTGKVLEIGTGSGYQAAVLSSLFEQVYTVERIPELSRRARKTIRDLGIENVHFKIFDGTYGWGEFAPYKAIVVTAGAPDVPATLVEQLEDSGRLVIPITTDHKGTRDEDEDQTLTVLTRRRGRNIRENHGPCRFVPLVGKYGWDR
ncbi:MAG: protein-L-isoaspartate(D-aspartate) O-methyltransferase [Acidobacteria bacterium]|uniref:Protein-L-isoaspartate O-methyltransferase n=1 Tax=Candidatus Polarisedimenticola svalbardensis TaxID=2886004 RepID=A0A8J7CDF0_9BACT|nr:protein-L-isoaspartate(D-aspartate) O-methyltransferase [Candidatus Polarisedimenticola svalbardensis]